MDTQELKILAARLRAFLERRGHALKHGHSLDLIAAIPGLRNWPEVGAFPARVREATLDEVTAARLARNLAERRGISTTTGELLRALTTTDEAPRPATADVWPDGPTAGIYVATSQAAIDALIARYEREAPGHVLYGEQAASGAESAIDLGESGIFSKGLLRAPSGTLVILGPMEMTQETWEDNGYRMWAARSLVDEAQHRVVILATTPSPSTLHSDLALLLQLEEEPGSVDETLRGNLIDGGEFVELTRFVNEQPAPILAPIVPPSIELPAELAGVLKKAIQFRPHGIIIVAEGRLRESRFELLEAVLPLTEHAGPAARIQPNFRGGYGRDDTPLSSRFAGVPVCASIESAYAHGYRRMLIERPDSAGAAMMKYAAQVCFLVDAYGEDVSGAFMSTLRPEPKDEHRSLQVLIAILCVSHIENAKGCFDICDAYIAHPDAPTYSDLERNWDYAENNRVIRWEDGLRSLVARELVTRAEAKQSLRRLEVDKALKQAPIGKTLSA
jgi:hypothetical protein